MLSQVNVFNISNNTESANRSLDIEYILTSSREKGTFDTDQRRRRKRACASSVQSRQSLRCLLTKIIALEESLSLALLSGNAHSNDYLPYNTKVPFLSIFLLWLLVLYKNL